MESKLTIRQVLTTLESGKTLAMCMGNPVQPRNFLFQASRVGEVYYVTGLLFQDYAPEVDLTSLFEVGLANDDDQASVTQILNQYLAAARLHACQGLEAAYNTLSALLATYALSIKQS